MNGFYQMVEFVSKAIGSLVLVLVGLVTMATILSPPPVVSPNLSNLASPEDMTMYDSAVVRTWLAVAEFEVDDFWVFKIARDKTTDMHFVGLGGKWYAE